MSKHPRPCVVCREKARHGKVCDDCRAEANAASRQSRDEIEVETPVVLPAAPFIEWLDRQRQFSDGGISEIARVAGVTDDWLRKGAFRRVGIIERHLAEQVLEAHDVFAWEVWDELPEDAPEDEPVKPTVDKRGRDCTKPRGVACRLTDKQLAAAYRLHTEAGLSTRELGRRGWETWGYASPKAAAVALSNGFKRLGLVARDRVEATVKASTIHGKSPRSARASDPGYSEHRKAVRRASGEVRGVKCAGVRTQYPRKGQPCQHYALYGSDYCLAHDPERAVERAAHLAEARSRRVAA